MDAKDRERLGRKLRIVGILLLADPVPRTKFRESDQFRESKYHRSILHRREFCHDLEILDRVRV